MEIWKDIPEYEGLYEASNYGRVRTKEGKTTYANWKNGTRKRVWKQRVLKQKTDKNGYKRVTLYKDGEPKTFLVHRLVAFCFIPSVDGKENINHIDGDPSNNYVDNLEWADYRDNLLHAFENKLNKSQQPVYLKNKKTEEIKRFSSKAEASRYLNKNNGYISNVLNQGSYEVKDYLILESEGAT